MLALLQVTLIPHLTVAHVQPDVVLVAVVCWALVHGPTEGAVWGFLGGLALDMLSAAPFGMHTATMTIVGIAAGTAAALIPSELWLLPPGASVLCTILQQGICAWFLRTTGWPIEWGTVLTTVVLPAALLNLLLTVPLYQLARLLNRRGTVEEPGW